MLPLKHVAFFNVYQIAIVTHGNYEKWHMNTKEQVNDSQNLCNVVHIYTNY